MYNLIVSLSLSVPLLDTGRAGCWDKSYIIVQIAVFCNSVYLRSILPPTQISSPPPPSGSCSSNWTSLHAEQFLPLPLLSASVIHVTAIHHIITVYILMGDYGVSARLPRQTLLLLRGCTGMGWDEMRCACRCCWWWWRTSLEKKMWLLSSSQSENLCGSQTVYNEAIFIRLRVQADRQQRPSNPVCVSAMLYNYCVTIAIMGH